MKRGLEEAPPQQNSGQTRVSDVRRAREGLELALRLFPQPETAAVVTLVLWAATAALANNLLNEGDDSTALSLSLSLYLKLQSWRGEETLPNYTPVSFCEMGNGPPSRG